MLLVDPTLPAWLPDLTLRDLRFRGETFELRFRRIGETSIVEVMQGDPAKVVQASPDDA